MTKVFFSFDTEDYSTDGSWDATKRISELLKKYNVKGVFNIVGYLAREWVRQDRLDVPEALKGHDIGFHSLRHSYHPTICEYTDLEDYNEARIRLLTEEAQGLGMVKAVMGCHDIKGVSLPGMSVSYVAYYEYAKLGMYFNGGSALRFKDGRGFHFCNLFFCSNSYNMESMFFNDSWMDLTHYDADAFPDYIAGKKCVLITNHPNRAVYNEYWDLVNYYKVNKYPMYHWKEAPKHTNDEIEYFFEQFEKLIVKLKNDDRFEIGSVNDFVDYLRKEDAARVMTRDQLPEVLRQLKEKLWFVTLPTGTFSLTDCFAAAAHFLSSNEPYKPAFVRGFLDEPEGVSETTTLSADEIKAAVKEYEPDTFLPNFFTVGNKKIGPADLLFAMLEVACGADEVTILPKKQMPELVDGYAVINELKLTDTFVHSDDFHDDYLTKRLRLQTWTIRE